MAQFEKGNKHGGSVPHAARIAEIRKLIFQMTDDTQVLKLWSQLLTIAERPGINQLRAIGMVFERLLGPPESGDLQMKVDRLEELVNQFVAQRQAQMEPQLKAG